jgi:hypothetical protein
MSCRDQKRMFVKLALQRTSLVALLAGIHVQPSRATRRWRDTVLDQAGRQRPPTSVVQAVDRPPERPVRVAISGGENPMT